MKKLILQSVRLFAVLTVLVGIGYPVLVTLIGQSLFADKANGSLIKNGDQVVGSELVAQKTESPRLFWPRPSASDYGAVPSGASNQGPTSETLKAAIQERREKGLSHEMLYASGSGLDPHISLDAALGQLPRIVQSRQLSDIDRGVVETLVKNAVEKRDLGFLGEERINVLKLNLQLVEKFGK